uniref:Isthmin-1-like n=1 Tax=Diabrotica virgifera virgifera TaxID=50390 RepID=A0A6P7G6T4_DIAVI
IISDAENRSTKTVPTTTKSTEPRWDQWTQWSPCSVSCGRGRNIRWRNCRENCREAETEMEEKRCQMPACPQKLFGLIKL